MQKKAKSDVQVHKLTEGAYLACSPQGNVLFGCPPEILKRILSLQLPMPDTVVVSARMFHNTSSQASLEFPLYHFLFVQRGLERKRKFQVVASSTQIIRLAESLRMTVVGPTEAEMIQVGTPPALAREIYQETHYMALKDPSSGKPFEISEMIDFIPVDVGASRQLYPMRNKMPEVLLERETDVHFRLLYGEQAFDMDLSVSQVQTPNYKLHAEKHKSATGDFTVTVLGRSNGFDPNDPANGYLMDVDGHLLLWDCPAYLNLHLEKRGLTLDDIEALVLSHVHEDHIDIVESVRKKPLPLYTTPEIHYSLMVKLMSVYGCSLEEAKKLHEYHPLEPGKPVKIQGATLDVFHSVHAIPALGGKITWEKNGKKGLLHISGDHLSNAAIEAMKAGEGISPRRYEMVHHLLNGKETLILMDAGGGIIHGDYRDFLTFQGKGRIGFMHTGIIQGELPPNMTLVQSGQVLKVTE